MADEIACYAGKFTKSLSSLEERVAGKLESLEDTYCRLETDMAEKRSALDAYLSDEEKRLKKEALKKEEALIKKEEERVLIDTLRLGLEEIGEFSQDRYKPNRVSFTYQMDLVLEDASYGNVVHRVIVDTAYKTIELEVETGDVAFDIGFDGTGKAYEAITFPDTEPCQTLDEIEDLREEINEAETKFRDDVLGSIGGKIREYKDILQELEEAKGNVAEIEDTCGRVDRLLQRFANECGYEYNPLAFYTPRGQQELSFEAAA